MWIKFEILNGDLELDITWWDTRIDDWDTVGQYIGSKGDVYEVIRSKHFPNRYIIDKNSCDALSLSRAIVNSKKEIFLDRKQLRKAWENKHIKVIE